MFCQNCGKELPDNAKFCSGCGSPVTGPEVEEAAEPQVTEAVPPVYSPADDGETQVFTPEQTPAEEETVPLTDPARLSFEGQPVEQAPVAVAAPIQEPVLVQETEILTGKKRRGKSLLLLAAIVVVLVVLVVGIVKIVPSLFSSKAAYVYLTDDSELMFLKKLKQDAESVELSDEEGAGSVQFSEDGKYLYFVEQESGYGTGDLYVMAVSKIGKKDAEPEKISADVGQYKVLNGGKVLYLKGSSGDGQLRLYDGKESYKLASDVSYFFANGKQTYAYYTEYDSDGTETLYRVAIKQDGSKEKLLSGVDQIYGGYSYDVLVYGKYSDSGDPSSPLDIYVATPGEKGTKVLEEVYAVYDTDLSSGKAAFTYVTAQTEERTLYDFVTDSMAASDANASAPSRYDYGQYGSWGWWETDWDAYNAAQDAWYAARSRNSIRNSLKDTAYDVTTYTLFRYEDGKTTQIAEGLDDAYPARDGEAKVYIYSKTPQDLGTVADVADLSYYGEVYELLDSGERTWYQNVNGTESELKLDDDDAYVIQLVGVLDGKEAVLEVFDGSDVVLQGYSLGKSSLTFTGTITDDEYTGLDFNSDKDAVYFYTDLSKDGTSGELVCYKNGEKTTVAKDVNGVWLLEDSDTIFKVEDQDYNSRTGATEWTLCAVRGGKDTQIADEVTDITILGAKQVVYISDGDLYLWNGSDSVKLADDVTMFWASDEASTYGYGCY